MKTIFTIKWYIFLSVANLYIVPFILLLSAKTKGYDTTDTFLAIIIVQVPLGWLINSFIFGLIRRGKSFFYYLCGTFLLVMPILSIHEIAGNGFLEKTYFLFGAVFWCAFISTMGLVVGTIINIIGSDIKSRLR